MWKTSSLNPKYEVNELGQVRNATTKNILSPSPVRNGYYKLTMYNANGQRKDRYVHVLVAYEFVEGRTEEKCFVNHKDFDKSNNKASNLEWVSHKENMEHWRLSQPFATKNEPPIVKRENMLNRGKCPVIQFDLNGNELQRFDSYMDAQRATGIRSGNISLCCQGKRHTAGGFIWRDLIKGSETIENTEQTVSEQSRVKNDPKCVADK